MKKKIKIAVIGLGGVGGYISASLVKSGCDVIGFARGEHLQQIQKSGIKIVEDDKSWIQTLNVKNLDDADGYFDIVLFCVKSYDLIESYKKISSYIDEKSILLTLSNGVSNEGILRELSNSIVVDSCIYILSHIQENGVIRKKGKVFATVIGGKNIEAVLKIKDMFERAKLRVKVDQDIQTALWKKYIFISAFATLTSYYNNSIGYIYKFHKDEAIALLNEIASVAKSLDIDIFDEVEKSIITASKVPYNSSTSMYLDFQKGRKNEVDILSGHIVNLAKKNNVLTPIMDKMYIKLKGLVK